MFCVSVLGLRFYCVQFSVKIGMLLTYLLHYKVITPPPCHHLGRTGPLGLLTHRRSSKAHFLVSQHLESHSHPASLVPKNMTMQCPYALIVSSKAQHNVAKSRYIDGIPQQWALDIEWATSRPSCWIKGIEVVPATFSTVG